MCAPTPRTSAMATASHASTAHPHAPPHASRGRPAVAHGGSRGTSARVRTIGSGVITCARRSSAPTRPRMQSASRRSTLAGQWPRLGLALNLNSHGIYSSGSRLPRARRPMHMRAYDAPCFSSMFYYHGTARIQGNAYAYAWCKCLASLSRESGSRIWHWHATRAVHVP
jgi:hypothetical protein